MKEAEVQDQLEIIFNKNEGNDALQEDFVRIIKTVTSAVTRRDKEYFRLSEKLKGKYAGNEEALADIKRVVSVTLDLIKVCIEELAPTLTREAA